MAYLRATLKELEARSLRASICTRTEIGPARAICACGDENNIDMIAIVRRGLGLAGRLLLGSVADKVTRTSDLPVISYRLEQDPG